MKMKEWIRIFEEKYPKDLAEDWDNVGFLFGDPEKEIHKILFALDITYEVIAYATSCKADMIVTHHPFIFHPLKRISLEDDIGRKIFSLAKAGINVYTLHTNLDSQRPGLNDYLLEKIEIFDSKILDKREDGTGIGRIFSWKEGKSLSEVEKLLKEKLQLPFLRVVAIDTEKKIFKIGFVNGSGMSYWKLAKAKDVDAFITGDVSYHDALDASESGMVIFDIGHFEAERFFVELLLRDLSEYAFSYEIFPGRSVFRLSTM